MTMMKKINHDYSPTTTTFGFCMFNGPTYPQLLQVMLALQSKIVGAEIYQARCSYCCPTNHIKYWS